MLSQNNIQHDATLKIQQLANQSVEICRGNPSEGIAIAEEIISLADSIKSDAGLATGLACKGACLIWLGNYDTALQALFEAIPNLQKFENKKI